MIYPVSCSCGTSGKPENMMVRSLVFIFLLSAFCGFVRAIEHETVTSTVDGLYVRSQPSVSGEIHGKLKQDETAVLIGRSTFSTLIGGRNSYWYKIRSARGIAGWVFGGYITIEGETPVSPLEMKWVTRCQAGPGELTFVEKSPTSSRTVASLDRFCIYLQSKDSEFETDYFSPVSQQERLHLYIAGLETGARDYELKVEYRLELPICRECNEACRRLHEIVTIQESLQFTHDFAEPAVVGLADGVIEDWRLMGLSASVRLYSEGSLLGIREITLPGWPWCD